MTEVAEPAARNGGMTSAVAWLAASHARAIAALLLLSLLCFLPGLFSIQPIDRDEARFAQASRQMLETGDFVDIRMHDEPRYKKPVGIYWLQAAVVTLAGENADAPIGYYRIASVIGAVAAVLLLYWATIPLFGRETAFVAAALFAASLMLATEAHLAKTDAVLAATVVLAQGALARIYLRSAEAAASLRDALLFWLGIGLGFLIKGPVILMVSGLTILALVAFDRKLSWLRGLKPLIGVPLALLIVLPWFIAILSIAGSEFLSASVGHDLLGKVAAGQEGHGAPPGTHLALLFAMFFPGIALAIVAVPWVWRNRRQAAVRFCLAWIVPCWLVFEAVVTKLPHYTLPTYPAIAALAAAGAVGGFVAVPALRAVAAIVAAIVAIGLPAVGVAALHHFEGVTSVAGIGAVLLAVVLAAIAGRALLRGEMLDGAGVLVAAAIAAYVYVFSTAIPALDAFRLSPRLAEAVARVADCKRPQVISAGYEEPSLIFAVGTDIRFGNGVKAADFLAKGGCRVALVAPKQAERFAARAAEQGFAPTPVETVRGFNLGHFADLAIAIYRAPARASAGQGSD